MIEALNKNNVTDILKRAVNVLNNHFKEEGIEFRSKGGKFDDVEALLKLSMNVVSDNAKEKKNDKNMNEWNMYAAMYNLPKDGIGKTFKSGGSEFKICGIEPRKHKYPVIAEEINTGKKYKFSMEQIRHAFS